MAYIVSLSAGQLFLGGRMTVSRIVSREEAVRVLGNDDLYDDAREWLLDDTPEGGTPLRLRRRLSAEVARQITCTMADGSERGLFFVDDENLDVQATRGVRELTPASAELLEKIIKLTDPVVAGDRLLTVTADILHGDTSGRHNAPGLSRTER